MNKRKLLDRDVRDNILHTYLSLPPQEREIIDRLVETLISSLHTRFVEQASGLSVEPQFGKISALELLAKLGIFLSYPVSTNWGLLPKYSLNDLSHTRTIEKFE